MTIKAGNMERVYIFRTGRSNYRYYCRSSWYHGYDVDTVVLQSMEYSWFSIVDVYITWTSDFKY